MKEPDKHIKDARKKLLEEFNINTNDQNNNEHIAAIKNLIDLFEEYKNKESKEQKDAEKKVDNNTKGTTPYFSIIGSVLLRTGWPVNIEILNKNCIVIRPRKK